MRFSPENIEAAFSALAGIGYRPIVPVTAADFASPLNAEIAGRLQDKIDIEFLRKLADGAN